MKYFILLFSLLFLSQLSNSQDLAFSGLDKSPLDVVMYRGDDQAAIARIIYSRPAKRDRVVFGELVPYGQVWRTGANEATEITFYKDVTINDELVEAGTYSIFTIPGEENWKFILNSQTTQWGTRYDNQYDIFTTDMKVSPAPETIENFSIRIIDEIDGGTIFMGWDDRIASLHFDVAAN
ncbi:DUF2911 domain-containing protein [Nonlabens agnitus]|uniref:Asparagine synthetase B n=1 Tax=Nonlabens agnitus TaxID=870484 RepID=A0A2S9WXZ7_9FLAO|nr:DUF2911 domain-containing protein [Nonlabens agnitus]PRP68350.1 asparagine synthetase B [Nonlabens agnitus]